MSIQVTIKFWKTWKEFEIKHGNEDTVREMLRVRRSVQATYNTQVNFMSSQISSANQGDEMDDEEDEMKRLEKKARKLAEEEVKSNAKENINFVSGTDNPKKPAEEKNPEELEIDWSDEDETVNDSEVTVEKQIVPDEVYGGLKRDTDD